MADDFKYHIDHHASLVAPPQLERAREAHEAGTLDDAGLGAAQDAAITDALHRQRRLGLAALCDGGFRRRTDLAVVYDGVDGFGAPSPSPLASLVGRGHAAEARPLTGRPAERGRLAKHEAEYLRAGTDRSTMLALPAPGYVAELAAADEAAGLALAAVVRGETAALAGDGIDHVLLRNPAYGFLLRADGRAAASALGLDPAAVLARMLTADAAAVADLDVPAEFRVSLDLTTAGAATGAWDAAAVRDFLDRQPFSRICVEYPKAAGDRFPLHALPAGLVVSLGVVDVADPDLEDADELVARIDEAAEVVDIDDIAIATNGGFHAVPPVPEALEHAKLQRVEMTARYFWGNEL